MTIAAKGKMNGIAPNSTDKVSTEMLTKVLNTRLTDDSNIPEVEPTIWVKDGIFAIKGDISFVSGMAKSGKSTICRYIIATALMETISDDFDSLGIRSVYSEGRPVIYIDTEQPKAFTMKAVNEIKRLLKTDRIPDNLHVFNWRHQAHKENRESIEALFSHFTDAALWIVDGITDFLGSANDEEKGNELINLFMRHSTDHNTTIVLLIHELQNSGKLRGHLGSEAERKCGGAISVRKDRETKTHWIQPKLIRGSGDFDNYPFQYDESLGKFVSLSDARTKELRSQGDKRESRLAELYAIATAVYGDRERLSRSDLNAGIRTQVIQKHNQAKDSYDKAIRTVIKQMSDEYNVITNIGESKDSYKFLRPIEVTV